MTERPILFSAPMVRAILAGKKTQTRRLVKPQPPAGCEYVMNGAGDHALCFAAGTARSASPVCVPPTARSADHRLPCPYGIPGDRLWVREAFRSWRDTCYQRDVDDEHECDEHCDQTYVAYAATPREGYRPRPDRARVTYLDESTPLESNRRLLGPWKPSIHMPRWASRLTPSVASVRVERLQEISEEDARAEGVEVLDDDGGQPWKDDARTAFRLLWDGLNGKRAPWASNPWVWAVTFEKEPTP